MRFIARSALLRFLDSLEGHRDYRAVKASVEAWFHEVREAEWSQPSEVKAQYRNASIVGADRVVFNLKGNDYRLVAAIDYSRHIVFIKWIGSPKNYDKIDVGTVRYADQTD